MRTLKRLTSAQLIILGFASVILIGTILLLVPISTNGGVKLTAVDALFTSTSAVCVTGLVTVDTADTYTVFGRTIVGLLIQIGGLGVTSVGVGIIILAGGKVDFKQRLLVKEALNFHNLKGIVKLVKAVLLTTLIFEGVGVILSFIVFIKDYEPLSALGISIFHSVAAFNNSGFDILGGFKNLLDYKDNILLNLTTCGLIIFGGLGFLVIREIVGYRKTKKLSLHSKIVIFMTILLLLVGTILLKFTENIPLLGAFFYSTSARTAGFSSYPLSSFTNAGLFILTILMFIGASPGSTGGGIKTTTAFVLIKESYSIATNKHCTAFKRKIPNDVILKSFVIMLLAGVLVCLNTFILCILEPNYTFIQLLFEVTSAFGTVGLSTGITPYLCSISKVFLIITMFVGRVGPLTAASIWTLKSLPNVHYAEESIAIG